MLWTALLDRTKHRKIIFYDNDETRTFRFTRRKRNATFSIAVSVVSFFLLYCGAISQFSLVCLSVCTQLAIFVRFCTRHTLVRQGTISLLFFFLCPVTGIWETVAPIDVKFSIMVHIDPGQKVSPLGGSTPGEPRNPKFWA